MSAANDKEKKSDKTTAKLQLAKERNYLQDLETDNPWDYKKKPQLQPGKNHKGSFASKNTRMVMQISRLVVYLAAIGMIGVFLFLSLSEHVDIFANIMKYRSILTMLTILFIVDAIILNVMFEKNVILILFAWILNFIYPWKRDKTVHEGITGKVLTIGIIAALIAMTGTFFAAFTTYGAGTLIMDDESSRHMVAECLEQEIYDGKMLGNALFDNFDIQKVQLNKTDKDITIIFNGAGNVKANGESIADKALPTILTFKKETSEEHYKLVTAEVDDEELRANRLKDYERQILE